MKAIILLSVFCLALADQAEHQADPCVTQCREAVKTKLGADPNLAQFKIDQLTAPEGRTKIRTLIKEFATGTGNVPSFVTNPETMTKLCTISTEADTCLNACRDSPMKMGGKKLMGVFRLGCDEDFKSSANCLAEVKKQPSEECKTKCQAVATKLNEFITQRDANPNEVVHAPKEVLESGCKLVNCRLNCRKTDIVNKCQEKGFEQAKKLASAMADFAKVLYKRSGGDLNNWPDNCKSENVIQHNEY